MIYSGHELIALNRARAYVLSSDVVAAVKQQQIDFDCEDEVQMSRKH